MPSIQDSEMKKQLRFLEFRRTQFIWLVLAFLLLSFRGFSQSQITGKVFDEKGEPLTGATIQVLNASDGAVTDIYGAYSIETDLSGYQDLQVSSMGYQTVTMMIDLDQDLIELDFNLVLDLIGLDAVIVTGVSNPKSKLVSSVSISTIRPETIQKSSARTTAELFRIIPGIKSEASAGEGNTNISVRGVPISSGGSRYLQLQEDGLPLLLYGDIAFNTQDQYLRADRTIQRIEAIRGGSAATTTSNGPAGIINFISNTGDIAGGSLATSFGLDYNSYRTDFEYGSPLGNGMTFHVGGFFRKGEGPRKANHTVNLGGQLKASLSKNFSNGVARVYYKMLNDRTAAYMPMPIEVTGTNSSPTWKSVGGFDAVSNGLQSPFLSQNFGYGSNGNERNVNVSDGIHTVSNSIGTYFEFDLNNNWIISSRSRLAFNGGRFVAPFTAQVGTTNAIIDPIVIANGDTTATGAAMPYTLSTVSQGAQYADTQNGLAQRIHMFDVELENFNNFMSDTKLQKSFDGVDLTVGLFTANQNIEMSWLWNTYLSEVSQDADLINVNVDGRDLTQDGLANYGVPLWGNCCTGKYNTNYDVLAPYLNMGVELSTEFNVDASIRYDDVRVRGFVLPSQQLDSVDINGNGVIDAPERSVSRVSNTNPNAIRYNYNYVSYSLGVNYLLSNASAVFARVSQGYVGNGERATWHQNPPVLSNGAPKNSLFQGELGYKQRLEFGGLFLTAFYAKTKEEAGVEATTQRVLSNDYRSLGLEVEGDFQFDDLGIRAAATYVNAEIVDNNSKVNIGNKPRRQPAFSYNLQPAYTLTGGHEIGFTLIGQTKAFAQDNNDLVMPAYAYLNVFASMQLSKGLSIAINANNLTNAMGITESEEGSIVENTTNYLRARSIAGRSILGSVIFSF